MTGKEDVVQALIEAGADVNFGNPPPITIAAQMGRLNSVKLMIEHNVNVNAEILYEYFMMFTFFFIFHSVKTFIFFLMIFIIINHLSCSILILF